MFTEREIIEHFHKDNVNDINETVNYILTKLNLKVEDVIQRTETEKYDQLRIAVKTLKSKFKLKWKASKRTMIRFQTQYAT